MSRSGSARSSSPSRSCSEARTNSSASLSTDSDREFGAKSIGYFAGTALLVNNITGPGIPQLPNMFVEAGWLLPTVCIVCVWLMTTLSSAMFAEAMRRIPGNEHFRGRVEFTTIVKHFFGYRWYLVSQISLNGALQSLNMISIILSTQVLDSGISAVFGKSCALNLTPFGNTWKDASGTAGEVAGSTSFFSCIDAREMARGDAWGCHIVFTLGFAVTMALAIPCGRWNLEDNMVIQTVAFALTAACWAAWVVMSLMALEGEGPGLAGIPAVNTDPATGSQAAVLGVILFNFGFVTTVPSWINEKKADVSVNKTLHTATFSCVVVYLLVGLAGAAAFADVLQGPVTDTCRRQQGEPSFNCPNDLLSALSAHLGSKGYGAARYLVLLSVYLYPLVAVVSSIPVFSIVVKYNLIENGFSKTSGTFLGVLLPWIISFPLLYMPNVLSQIVNLTSLIFVSFTDFIAPLCIYVVLVRREEEARSAGSEAWTDLDAASSDAHVHRAFPLRLGLSPGARRACALGITALLGVAASLALVLAIREGSYSLSASTCALVGTAG